jgi:hypothetical protein
MWISSFGFGRVLGGLIERDQEGVGVEVGDGI